MASTSELQLYQGQLPNAIAALLTADSVNGTRIRINSLVLANTDTATHAVTLAVGGNAAANHILSAAPLPASKTWVIGGPIYLEPGAALYGLADAASKVTLTVNGEKWST